MNASESYRRGDRFLVMSAERQRLVGLVGEITAVRWSRIGGVFVTLDLTSGGLTTEATFDRGSLERMP